jgi:hypothetical protein
MKCYEIMKTLSCSIVVFDDTAHLRCLIILICSFWRVAARTPLAACSWPEITLSVVELEKLDLSAHAVLKSNTNMLEFDQQLAFDIY